jgi:nucleotide-binding universal stress UspA family protein
MNRHRILVAYDGSQPSFLALQRAADHASENAAQIGVVTVGVGLADALADARRYLLEQGLQPEIHRSRGRLVAEIARVTEEGAYHTLFLGSRDGAVGRAIERSVSRGVAVRTPASQTIGR